MSQIDRNLKTTFDRDAEGYDAIRPGYPKEAIDCIIGSSGIQSGASVLELGCGTGQATESFLDRGFKIHAVDLGASLIEIAQKKFANCADVTLENIAFESMEIESNSLDLIYSATPFHWLDPELRYKNTAKWLKEDGMLAIISNRDSRQDSPLRLALDKVYQEVSPSEPTDKIRQSTYIKATNSFTREIESSGFFKDVDNQTWLWLEEYSVERYMALLETFSFHRSLPDDKRAFLYEGIQREIRNHGGVMPIRYETSLVLAKAK